MASEKSSSEDKATTKEWLETILEGYYKHTQPDDFIVPEVDTWEISPACSESDGYLSEMLALDITYIVGGESKRVRLVAKLLPQDQFNRAFVIETQFDLREIKFYREIRPALEEFINKQLPQSEDTSLSVPKCYHALHKPGAESILVLADLRDQGYALQSLTAGLSRPQVDAALECLAKFHAATYAYHIREAVDFEEKFPYLLSITQAVESFQRLVDRGLPLLLKFLQNKKEFSRIRDCLQGYSGEKASQTFYRVLSKSTKLNTLVHGDFWCNNLMFKTVDRRVMCQIVDWQMLTYGSPAVDLAMIITTSLSSQLRRNDQKEIVSAYWSAFTDQIKKLGIKEELKYSLEELNEEVNKCQAHAALLVVGSVDIALGNSAREERVLSLLSDLIENGLF